MTIVAARIPRRQCVVTSEFALSDHDGSWVHVARDGTWEGHPEGAFTFDADVYDSIVRNFDAQENPLPVVVGHPEGEAPAVGWIRRMRARDGGLWVYVDWLPTAAQAIKDGAVKFVSGVFAFARRDRETGEEIGPSLLELGLTNRPFIDGLEELRLSETGMTTKTKMAEATEMEAPTEGESADVASMAKDAAQLIADAMGVSIEEAIAALGDKADAVAAELGADGSAAEEGTAEQLPAGDDVATSDAAIAAHKLVFELRDELAAMRKEQSDAARAARVDGAIESGLLLDDQRAFALSLSDAKLDSFLELASKRPAVPARKRSAKAAVETGVKLADLSAGERAQYQAFRLSGVDHDGAVSMGREMMRRLAAGENHSAALREVRASARGGE